MDEVIKISRDTVVDGRIRAILLKVLELGLKI
jgi:hypothetical protein